MSAPVTPRLRVAMLAAVALRECPPWAPRAEREALTRADAATWRDLTDADRVAVTDIVARRAADRTLGLPITHVPEATVEPPRYPFTPTRTDDAGHERCVHCGDRTDDMSSPHRIGCGEMWAAGALFDALAARGAQS